MTTSTGHEIQEDEQGNMQVSLPVGASTPEQVMGMDLWKLRDRIHSLEMQAYGLYIRRLFDEFPELIALRIENTDDYTDNGRHVSLMVEDCERGVDWDPIDKALEDRRDYLNEVIRHRGLYDYIDNVLAIKILQRKKIDQQLGKAYDDTFSEPGLWDRLQSEAAAAQLEHHTPGASTSRSRSRI